MEKTKLNIDKLTARKVRMICLLNGITQESFIKDIVDQYLKKYPLPREIKVTKDYEFELLK